MFESKIKLRARGGQASYGDKARGGWNKWETSAKSVCVDCGMSLAIKKYVGDVRDETERSTTRGVGP